MIGLRIAQVLDSLRVSAAASAAINLMRWLDCNGHQSLLVSGRGEREDDVREEGFQHLRYQHGGTGWWFGGRRRLLQELQAWKPDLLHVHQLDCLAVFLPIAAKLSIPLIVSVQKIPDAANVDVLKDAGISMILVPSEAARGKLVGRLGCSRDNVAVLPYGLDLGRYPVTPPSERIHKIGSVGRFEERFGFDVLLQAVATLRDEGHELETTLVGGGDGAARTEALIEKLRLSESVRIIPGAPRTGRILSSLDCFVYPALEDVLTIGVLKAMACARPVLASAVGSMPEWIRDGQNGCLLPPGDGTALTDALRTAITNPGQAAAMGEVARQDVATNHDIRLVGEVAHELYRSVLSSQKTSQVDTKQIRAYRRLSSVGNPDETIQAEMGR